MASTWAATSEDPNRTLGRYVQDPSDVDTTVEALFSSLSAEVVEWQTRTFEGRVAQAVRVQVPPSAPTQRSLGPRRSQQWRAIMQHESDFYTCFFQCPLCPALLHNHSA